MQFLADPRVGIAALLTTGVLSIGLLTTSNADAQEVRGSQCGVPADDALADASGGEPPANHYGFEDWIANGPAQAGLETVHEHLNARFGAPSADDANDPLVSGLVGTAIDDYQERMVVVVDTAKVDADELEKSLESAVRAENQSLNVSVQPSCHESAELASARRDIAERDWAGPATKTASYAYELDASTSTFHFFVDPKDAELVSALKSRYGDLVTIDSESSGFARESGSRTSDSVPLGRRSDSPSVFGPFTCGRVLTKDPRRPLLPG